MSEMLSIPDFNAPAYIYAVYRTHVDFGLYNGEDIDDENLLELHIFDSTKEFRAVYSTFRKQLITSEIIGDITNRFIDDKMVLYGTEMKNIDEQHIAVTENGRTQVFGLGGELQKLVFGSPDKSFTESFKNDDCLYVRNYYAYDHNDLLYLEGYRLLGITGGNECGKEK